MACMQARAAGANIAFSPPASIPSALIKEEKKAEGNLGRQEECRG